MTATDVLSPEWWTERAGVNLVLVALIVVLSQYAKLLGLPKGWPRRIPPLVLSLGAGFALASAGVEPTSIIPAGAPFIVRGLALSCLHLGAALALYWLGEERLRKMLPAAFRSGDTAPESKAVATAEDADDGALSESGSVEAVESTTKEAP